MESGVHLSNCHDQITYAKFNLKIHYPPPYEREIWHYQKASTDQIRKAIEQFSRDMSLKNLDIKGSLRYQTITSQNVKSLCLL